MREREQHSNRNSRDPESPDVAHTVEERYNVNGASEECSGAPVDGAGGV
jgi:hypothetical protein